MKSGFSLIELLITLMIIAILTAIAIPAYQNYTRRAYFSEIVLALQPFKLGVVECFTKTSTLDECNSGINGIPEALTQAEGAVQSIDVEAGIITATPVTQHGINAEDTYILTPTPTGTKLTWIASGIAVSRGLS